MGVPEQAGAGAPSAGRPGKGRCLSGQVAQGRLLTLLLRLQLFPELVFQAEEESGEGPLFLLIVGGRFVQERAHHTLL